MRLPLHQFLTRLGSPGLNWDDVDPVCFHDPASDVLVAGEVRLMLQHGESLSCSFVRQVGRGRRKDVFGIRAVPDDDRWGIVEVFVAGRRVQADHAAALDLAGQFMAEIRSGKVPDFDDALRELPGEDLRFTRRYGDGLLRPR